MTDRTRILIIDDEPNALAMAIKTLEKAGYDVLQVDSGLEGFHLAQEQRPDLVLLHVPLPDGDGPEICRQIRSDPELAHAAVMVLSATGTTPDRQAKGLEAGADEYLTQPISDHELLARVQAMLRQKQAKEALRDSRQFFQSALNALSANIAVLDEEGIIIAVNTSWCRFGSENGLAWPDCGVGHNYLSVLDTASGESSNGASEAAQGIRDVAAGRRDRFWQEYPCHSPWEKRWYAMWVTRFQSREGTRVVILHENITQRKLAEEALREAKEAAEAARREAELTRQEEQNRRHEAERRRRIAESLRDVLSLLNSTHSLQEVLDYIVVQAGELLGSPAVAIYRVEAEPGGLALHLQAAHGLPADASDGKSALVVGPLQDAVSTRRPVAIADATTGISSAHDTRTYQALLAVPILIQDQVYGGMLLGHDASRPFTHDEIELAAAFGDQVALAIETAHLRHQAEQTAVEAERSRLARELHDAVTQTLFSASIIAESLPRIWDRYPDEVQRGLEELRQLTRGALAEMRTLLLELRPLALTEKPLGELLRHLTDALNSRSRVPIALTSRCTEMLPASVQVVLYRIAQEALNNVAKHANARRALVELDCGSGRAMLRVEDDGAGFDPSAVPPGHLGLSIMRERAAGIGATLTIESEPHHGTCVVVEWQQENKEKADDLA